MVSAKIDIDNKVNLLLGDAVDYVTKPFHTEELLARIAVHLRSTKQNAHASSLLTFDDITLNMDTHIVSLAISRTLVEQMGGTISADYESHRLRIKF